MLRKPKFTLALAAVMFGAACEPRTAAEENAAHPIEQNESNLAEALPLATAAMDRAEFLRVIADAANAHAAGLDDRSVQSGLDGKRFSIRVRFGCSGAEQTDSDSALRWSVGKNSLSYEVRATPDISRDEPMLHDLPNETIESVEGFWIPRPWLSADACPRPARETTAAPETTEGPEATEVEPAPPIAGIAEYFTKDDSRVRSRAGRAYSAVEKLGADEALPADGLILLLEGRLTPWPDGRVVRCSGDGSARAPTCIASAHLDRAAILRPKSDKVIAEWRD